MKEEVEGILGRRIEGTERREATLLTATTEVRGKALEKRWRWNWLK